ncbi:MAG: D-alanyl-D-alanine carboxypeptidase/D-alanyl-D-alanine-endopeptidase [Desulfovibrio sp.]|nr:D-alanyl-D-alanine carboxypeptidase/D-alanyl-D-alanine-endopeptidase [Desulfovibrio sp.]MCA1986450.1 D-alanyl-D-alanine carboxypeptidase/D-alanyl-D-alanine-endopeptidase [Desulfovibrio sp.]
MMSAGCSEISKNTNWMGVHVSVVAWSAVMWRHVYPWVWCVGLLIACVMFCSNFCIAATQARVQALPTTTGCPAWSPQDIEILTEQLRTVIVGSGLHSAHVGAILLPLDPAAPGAAQYNAEKMFVPASTMKLFTTAAALDILGYRYTFTTEFLHTGTIERGILHGDLIVRSNGDPSFSAKWCPKNDFCMGEIADRLRDKGITSINGDLIADTSLFAGPLLGPAWEWDDLSYYYATPVDALGCGENTVEVSVFPARVGTPPTVRMVPDGYFTVHNQAITKNKGEDFLLLRALGAETVTIEGALSQGGKGISAAVSVNDPARYFLYNMKLAMNKKGIYISGQSKIHRQSSAGVLRSLLVRQSPPLIELATVANMESHNLFAELLQHAVAQARTGQGSFAKGAALVQQWAAGLGVGREALSIADGSGLSRKNLLTPRAMALMLRAMVDRPVFPEFYETLPVAGRHGSMARRLVGTKGEGTVRGKVGYVTGHSSIAGYAQDQQGRWVVFAVMVNNNAGEPKTARTLQDDIITLIVGR